MYLMRLLLIIFLIMMSVLGFSFNHDTNAAYLRDSSTSEIGYEDNVINMYTDVTMEGGGGDENPDYTSFNSTCTNDGQTIYTQSSSNYETAVTEEFGAGYTDSIVTYAQPYDGYSRTVRSQILYTVSLCDSYPGTYPDTTTFVFYHRGYYTIDTYFRVNIPTPPTVDITVGKNGGAQQSTTCPVQRTGTCGSYGYATGCWSGSPGYTDCTAPQSSNPDGSAGFAWRYVGQGLPPLPGTTTRRCFGSAAWSSRFGIVNTSTFTYTEYPKCALNVTTTDKIKVCWAGNRGLQGLEATATAMDATLNPQRWDGAVVGTNTPPGAREYGTTSGASFGVSNSACRDNLYFAVGTKEFRSAISNSDGNNSDYEQIEVSPGQLSCVQTVPPVGQSVKVGESVTLTALGGNLQRYEWDAGSRATPRRQDSNSTTFTTSFDRADNYDVEVESGGDDAECSVTVTAAPPPDPTNLTAVCNAAGTQVTTSWNPASGADSYLLRIDYKDNNTPSAQDGWYVADPPDLMEGNASSPYSYGITPDRPYRWWLHSNNASGISPGVLGPEFTCPATVSTLTAGLIVSPNAGNAPLNDVDLIATAGGTENSPTMNFTYYCNRADDGVNITSGWAAKYDNVPANQNPKTAIDACSNLGQGTYQAKVIIERGSLAAQNHATITVAQPPNGDPNGPTPTITQPSTFCSGPTVNVSWTYSDPDNVPPGTDPQSAYHVQLDDNDSFVTPIYPGSKTPGSATSLNNISLPNYFNQNVWARIKVWDSQGNESDWGAKVKMPGKTTEHQWPNVGFSYVDLGNKKVQFSDAATCYQNGGSTQACTGWAWDFDNSGNTDSTTQSPLHTYPTTGTYTAKLTATDQAGFACSATGNVQVKKLLPNWKEIVPRF